jgi:hypothetical protein
MICNMGGVATAAQAATFFGGPLAYAGYRRVRRTLRLPDTSVATTAARAQEWVTEPARTSASSASTTSLENCPPAQRRHSASASSVLSGAW